MSDKAPLLITQDKDLEAEQVDHEVISIHDWLVSLTV
jgi:hypothetical protein